MLNFIKDIVSANKSKKQGSASMKGEEDQFHADALTSLLKDPEATPDSKGWAMHTLLTKHGGMNDEMSGNVLKLITTLTGGADTNMAPPPAPRSSVDVTTDPTRVEPVPSPISGDLPRLALNKGIDLPIAPSAFPSPRAGVPATPPPAPPSHPVRNFLLRTLAGGLSGGQTEETLRERRRMELQQQLEQQRQESEIRLRDQLQQQGEERAITNAPRMQAAQLPGKIAEAEALQPIEIKRLIELRRQQGKLETEADWEKLKQDKLMVEQLVKEGWDKQDALSYVAPSYNRPPAPRVPSVEEQEMNDWITKEQAKGNNVGPAEWQAFKAQQGGEPLYPVMEGNTPVLRPRSVAAGKPTPTTIYQPSGLPTVAGIPGLSTQAPPPVPDITQASLAGWKQSISQIDQIMPLLKQAEDTLGPLAGRIKLAEVEKLGGMGATPEQIELATRLRRLLMSQAFAEGGKQLTPTEKEEFIAVNPHMTDTLRQAMINARLSKEYLEGRYQNRLDAMPVRERMQLQGGATPEAGGTGGTGGTVVMVGPDGKEWNVPRANIPVFKQNGYKEKGQEK